MTGKLNSNDPFFVPKNTFKPDSLTQTSRNPQTAARSTAFNHLQETPPLTSSLNGRLIEINVPVESPVDSTVGKAVEISKGSLFSNIKNSIASGVSWGVLKSLETLAFCLADLKKVNEKDRKKLQDLTGDTNLGNFLAMVSPKLVASIKNILDSGFVKNFIEDEEPFAKQLAETIVIKMMGNLAEAAKAYRYPLAVEKFMRKAKGGDIEDFPDNNNSVSLEDIISFTLKLVSDEYGAIEKEFAAIEASNDTSSEKNKALRVLVAPFTEKLLSILLPGGATDLPVLPGVRWGAWSVLTSKVVPDLLIDLMRQAKQLEALPIAASMLDNNEKKLASVICSKVGGIVQRMGGEAIAKKHEVIGKTIFEAFSADGTPSENEQMALWLGKQVEQIGLSENPHLAQAWAFAGKRSEALMLYVFQTLATSQKGSDYCFAAFTAIFESLSDFMSNHHEHLQKLKAHLEAQAIDALQNEEYIKQFEPLAMEWQKLMHLASDNQELPSHLLNGVDIFFKGALPAYLAQYYDTYLVPIVELYTKKPEEYHQVDVDRLKALLKNTTKPENIDGTVQQVENICILAAEQIGPVVQQIINDFLTLDSQNKFDVFSNLHIQELWNTRFLENFKNTLFKVLVNNIERSATRVEDMKQAPLLILKDILDAVLGNIAINGSQIQEAAAIKDPNERQLALRQFFKPMAADLLSILNTGSGENTVPLPVPQIFAKEVWKQLESTYLPDMLASLCLKSTSILVHSDTSRKDIEQRLPGSHIPESCHMMAVWVCQFMPGYLGTNRESISEDIFTAVTKYLKDTGNPTGISVNEYLQKNEEQIKEALCATMLGIPESDTIRQAQMGSKKYIETVFLHVCNGMTKTLHAIGDPKSDKYHSDVVLELAIQLLNVTSIQFAKINKVTKANKKSSPDKVSYSEMVKGLGPALHKGVPQTKEGIGAHEKSTRLKQALEDARIHLEKLKKNPNATPTQIKVQRKVIAGLKKSFKVSSAIESKERQQNFYIPFAKKLFTLAQLEKPNEISEAQWKMVQDRLLPQFLENILGSLLEPQTRNQLVLSIFDKIEKSLEVPLVSPYQSITEAMGNFNGVLESVYNEGYNKEVYTAARRLYNAVEFASGNPKDKVVKLRLKEMKKVIGKYTGTIHEEIMKSWSQFLEAETAFAVEQKRKKSAKTPLQRRLDKACGKLFLEIVQAVPNSHLKVLFKINKVNTLSGEMIGEIVREALVAQGSLIDIFDRFISSTIPTLTPGEWQGQGDTLHFVPTGPLNKFVDLSQDEIEVLEVEKIYQARKDAELAKEKVVAVGNKLLVGSIFDSLALPLQKLKELWDNTVDFLFGKYAPWLRQSIRFLGDKLIFRICSIVLGVAILPARKAFSLFTEFYVRYRASHFLNFIHLEIFEGLLYKLADKTLEVLNGSPTKKGDQWNFVLELVKAAKLSTENI